MRYWSSVLLSIVTIFILPSGAMGEEKRESLPVPVAPPGSLRFSFGPIGFKGLEAIPTMRDGFVAVHVTTDYAKGRGFGWVGAAGEVEKGWLEQRGRLHSRARRGPNDLLAGWIAGGLPFAVDLSNGKYLVTCCLGDWGEYEFYPFGSYTLLYRDREVFKSVRTRENMDQWIYRHKYADYERGQRLFDRYVKTRFDVITQEVEVADGKLTIQARQDAGPEQYTGAINYLVISPADQKDAHGKFLADLESRMRAAFDQRFPMAKVREAYCDGVTPAEKEAGFVLVRNPGEKVYPWTHGTYRNHLRELWAYAARGQFEPVDFAVIPLKKLGTLTAVCSELQGPQGAKIRAEQIKVGYVKYWDFYDRRAKPPAVAPEPYLVMDRNVIPATEPRVTRQFWITIHVPVDAAGGRYGGTITVTAEQGGSAKVPLVLDVIPLQLDGPGAVMLLNYSFPWKALYFGDERAWWADIEKELAFQRDHGMNSTAMSCHLPLYDEDTSEWEKFIDIYQKVGMDQPTYFAGTMNLYNKFTNLLDPQQQEQYCNVLKRLEAVAQRKKQKVIYSLCDEATNDGREALSELVARFSRDRLPALYTIGDINGYRELMRSAPHFRAAGFNNGWHGSYGTNRQGHQLITRTVIERVKSQGCEPWFVNGGVGRYPFGVFFWKMADLGVRGKCEWHYFASTSDPYNPFDGNQLNAFGSLVFPGLVPTLAIEESRAGIDDLRYVRTLQRVIAETRQHRDPLGTARAQAAQEALDYWTDRIPERLSSAHASDGAGSDTGLDFSPALLAQFRQEMAYHLCRLLGLDCPGICPPETMLASWEEGEQTGWTSKIKPAAEHATHGQMSGKMVFNREDTYFDTWGRQRVKDWRGFTSYRFDLFNPQSRELELVLTIRDQLAANVSTEVSARKTMVLKLKPGVNPVVVPLASLVDDGGKRPLDLSCIFNVYFSLKTPPEEATLYIDNMRLAENQ